MRSLAVLGLCVVAACDPILTRGIALAPNPATAPDTALRDALAVGARVAVRHGLVAFESPRDEARWDQCYRKDWVHLCGRVTDREAQFQLMQSGFRLTPLADSLRRELTDSLRARFGAEFVHECAWTVEPDRERSTRWRAALRAICVPLARREGREHR